jgi:hypothetical protein
MATARRRWRIESHALSYRDMKKPGVSPAFFAGMRRNPGKTPSSAGFPLGGAKGIFYTPDPAG